MSELYSPFIVDLETALNESDVLTNRFRSVIGSSPKLQASAPNTGLQSVVHSIFEDEGGLMRGEFLSRILRMPDVWRNAILEYVTGAKPYAENSPDIRITVRNTGGTCRVLMNLREIPKKHRATGAASVKWQKAFGTTKKKKAAFDAQIIVLKDVVEEAKKAVNNDE